MKFDQIKLTNINKSFIHKNFILNPLRFFFTSSNKNTNNKKNVLKNISFTIQNRDILGIIGDNGSGKSTLLKLLSGVLLPDSGSIILKGRLYSLLELGTGFFGDLSGYENIYLSCSLHGFSDKEIEKNISYIIDFSGLKDNINDPVKYYSSGMKSRLAFSIAVNLDFDILLIDEALSVGDLNFQQKALQKICDLNRLGLTVIIVSHDISLLKKICNKTLWLENGLIRSFGKTFDVCNKYIIQRAKLINKSVNKNFINFSNLLKTKISNKNRYGNFDAYFYDVSFSNTKGKSVNSLIFNDNYHLRLHIKCQKDIVNPIIGISINDPLGNQLIVCQSIDYDFNIKKFIKGNDYKIIIEFNNSLVEGNYSLGISIEKALIRNQKHESIDIIQNIISFKSIFKTANMYSNNGIVKINAKFKLSK
jgi:ABC-type polysaccharide/polyol phosphate transport system ATPase subunit